MLPPDAPPPPLAPRRPSAHNAHGDPRADDWHWLANRDDPEVTAYLEAENAYTEAILAPTRKLQETLFTRIRARVAETDISTPVFRHGWWYWSRTLADKQYPVYCRRPDPGRSLSAAQVLAAARSALPGAGVAGDGTPPPGPAYGTARPDPGQLLLDENELAAGSPYFALGVFDVRPDQQVLAYATDHDGSERYKLRFRDLGSGDDLADVVEDVYYGSAWASDCKSLYYVRTDKAMRPWQVWQHRLGTPAARDKLVFEESDERFFVSLGLSRSERYILVASESKMTSEVHCIRRDDEGGRTAVVLSRQDGVEYDVDHATVAGRGDFWLVRTNTGPTGERLDNFALFELPMGDNNPASLRPMLPYRPSVKIESVDSYSRHAVLLERSEGLGQLRVFRLADGEEHVVRQPESAYSLDVDASGEWDTNILRFSYSSLVSAAASVEYDMDTRERTTVKQATVGGGYRPGDLRTERAFAEAPDGARIPISIVCKRDQPQDGSTPCVLYGYGSYEIPVDPAFSYPRLNLLERGFAFAIAHVRGGGEMGRSWYEQGRLMSKQNTFTDFIACAEYLVANGWTSPKRLVARGGSAGGLLMGAVANMRPDLFAAIVAEVPFVDVVTTMSDDTLPLTVTEWEEWGNPRDDRAAYEYMKGYSPYDNVRSMAYPSMYVTAGVNDPRVGYWEPAKWVAKLRATKTDANPLLLRVEMGAGHQGLSGRYDAWRDEARIQAFIIASVGAEV